MSPLTKEVNGKSYISYDNGKTWNETYLLIKATKTANAHLQLITAISCVIGLIYIITKRK